MFKKIASIIKSWNLGRKSRKLGKSEAYQFLSKESANYAASVIAGKGSYETWKLVDNPLFEMEQLALGEEEAATLREARASMLTQMMAFHEALHGLGDTVLELDDDDDRILH